MQEEIITPDDLRAILFSVTDRIKREEGRLNSLDSAVGDGDHGITMRTGFDAVAKALKLLDPDAGMSRMLTEAGKAFMGATGGAIGVLMGKMLMSAGAALQGSQMAGAAEFKTLLCAVELAVSKTGKAQPGDKTILDAIHGARQAVADSHASLRGLAMIAANGAEGAANNTANMLCRVGRGSKLGKRVLGCPDPGAVSFAIILRAFSDWIERRSSSIADVDRCTSTEPKV
jgi:dihydroxyacetone kinase phosphoprotein-dependent L subunit